MGRVLFERGAGMTGRHATICHSARARILVTFWLAAGVCTHAHRTFASRFDSILPTRVIRTVLRVESISPPAWEQVQIVQEAKAVWELEAGTPPHLA